MIAAIRNQIAPRQIAHRLRLARRFIELDRADQWLILRAYVWLTAIAGGLQMLGFRRLVGFIVEHVQPERVRDQRPTDNGDGEREHCFDEDRARRYARWVNAASRHHFVRGQCLHRSLVLHFWLLGDGQPSELRIGVRKSGNELVAHAWVELAGTVLNDPPQAIVGFTPLGSQNVALAEWTALLPMLRD